MCKVEVGQRVTDANGVGGQVKRIRRGTLGGSQINQALQSGMAFVTQAAAGDEALVQFDNGDLGWYDVRRLVA